MGKQPANANNSANIAPGGGTRFPMSGLTSKPNGAFDGFSHGPIGESMMVSRMNGRYFDPHGKL